MGQPVKISDELIEDARKNGRLLHRSIAGQIELWAHLGRAIEPLLEGGQVIALRKAGTTGRVSALLDSVNAAAGQSRLKEYLRHGPSPRYEPASGRPGKMLRIDAKGRRTVGGFVGRRFVPAN